MSLSQLGFIEELQKQDRGYYKLLLSCPMAYDCKTLRFNVWRELATKEGKPFELGDSVCVNYHLKDEKFPTLDEIYLAGIDLCPNCGSANEAIDSQRMSCNDCSILPSDDQPVRIDEPMRLMSCAAKQYLYSTGYRIELCSLDPQMQEDSLVCVLFSKHLLYAKISNLKIGNVYNVSGWKHGNLIRLLNIC